MKITEKATIGNWSVNNRIIMAPMTRSRADEEGIISKLAATYYAQRASAGLIISESINISEQGIGMPNTPGIYTLKQVTAWKEITDAVHKAGGLIIAQLNHSGRAAHSLNRNGNKIVGASAIAIKNQQAFTKEGLKDFETPQSLSINEIDQVIQDYKIAAHNAMEAGFDGVELHAAMGFLPNQFLVQSSNQRTDEYGGTIQNRSKFILNIIKELIDAVGNSKVGIRLSPSVLIHDMFDDNPIELYSYLISQLNKLPIAYIHLIQPLFPLEDSSLYPQDVLGTFGELISKDIIVNGGYNRETAEEEIQNDRAQSVSFGSLFLANPDLPQRFALNTVLNEPDRATMYVGGHEKGYTDYPFLNETQK